MDPIAIGKQLKQQYPQYASLPDADLGNRYLRKYGASIQAVQGGQLKVTDLPQEQRVPVAYGMQVSGIKPDVKVQLKGKDIQDVNFNKSILDAAQAAAQTYDPKYTGFLDSKIGTLRTKFGGTKEQPEVEFRQRLTQIETAIRNLISGSAVSASEAKVLKDLIPKKSDSDQEVIGKLNQLQRISMEKIGNTLQTAGYDVDPKTYLKTDVVPVTNVPREQKGNPILNNPVTNFFIGAGKNLSNDAAVALSQKSETGKRLDQSLENARAMADQTYQLAQKTADPATKARLLKRAQETYDFVNQTRQQQIDAYSPDIEKNYLRRGLATGSEVATLAELPSLIKGTIGLPGKVKNLVSPMKAIAASRNAAIDTASKEGTKISGDAVAQAAVDAAGSAGADTAPQVEKFALRAVDRYAGRSLDPQEALDLFKYSQKAFKESGKAGKTGQAIYNKAVHDALVDEFLQKIPDVIVANRNFQRAYALKGLTGRTGSIAGGAALGSGVSYLLYKLLGGNNQ